VIEKPETGPAAAADQENGAAAGNTEVDNKVGGDQTGTQAGVVHGDIKTTINYFKDNQSELLARSVNKEELRASGNSSCHRRTSIARPRSCAAVTSWYWSASTPGAPSPAVDCWTTRAVLESCT
jgi:hypothetical protein